MQSATQLYVMRLLLGAAEAGFTPGIIYYLSCWYPRSDRARAMSFFYIGATLASMIGVPLSGTLLGLNGVLGIAGWRWLFLLEGIARHRARLRRAQLSARRAGEGAAG